MTLEILTILTFVIVLFVENFSWHAVLPWTNDYDRLQQGVSTVTQPDLAVI